MKKNLKDFKDELKKGTPIYMIDAVQFLLEYIDNLESRVEALERETKETINL